MDVTDKTLQANSSLRISASLDRKVLSFNPKEEQHFNDSGYFHLDSDVLSPFRFRWSGTHQLILGGGIWNLYGV